jgi:hypothetical protein
VVVPTPPVVEATGSAVMVTPGVSDDKIGGVLVSALSTLRVKSRTPPALIPEPKKSMPRYS